MDNLARSEVCLCKVTRVAYGSGFSHPLLVVAEVWALSSPEFKHLLEFGGM